MPRVTFLPANSTVEYPAGSLPYQGQGSAGSLLDVALNHEIELGHACGGICACTTCHVIVAEGDQNLSPMQKDEEDRLFRTPHYTLHSRLACRAVVQGDVVVRIPGPGQSAR